MAVSFLSESRIFADFTDFADCSSVTSGCLLNSWKKYITTRVDYQRFFDSFRNRTICVNLGILDGVLA